jgi:cytochrome c oxidase subunit 2
VQKAIALMAAVFAFAMTTIWVVLAQGPADQTGTPQIVNVSAKKFDFTPSEIHVRKGARVELKIHSEDVTHSVKLDVHPEGVKQQGTPGLVLDRPRENGKAEKHEDQVIDFVAQEPGTYDFKCSTFCGMGHNRMKGKVIVDP